MARINKKSRIKGLPPKISLQMRDSEIKQYSDTTSGISQSIRWDDTNAINFTASFGATYGTSIVSSSYSKLLFQTHGADIENGLSASMVVLPSFETIADTTDNPYFYYPLNNNAFDYGPFGVGLDYVDEDIGAIYVTYSNGPINGTVALKTTIPVNLFPTYLYDPGANTEPALTGSYTLSWFSKAESDILDVADGSETKVVFYGLPGAFDRYNVYLYAAPSTNFYSLNFESDQFSDTVGTEYVLSYEFLTNWNHYAITLDRNFTTNIATIKFYLNGVLVSEGSATYTFQALQPFELLYAAYSTNSSFGLNLSSLKLFDRVLSDEEIINNTRSFKDAIIPDINPIPLRKSIADNFITFAPQNNIIPFKENEHLDISSKAVDQTLTGSYIKDFYNSGSTVLEAASEHFAQPLSAKTKFVVDITPRNPCSIAVRNFTSSSRNNPMCYWNKDLGVWEGIGSGKEFSHPDYFYGPNPTPNELSGAYRKFFDEQPIGFGMTAIGNLNDYHSNAEAGGYLKSLIPQNLGTPISNFLFPVHNKFNATSSNLIKMSDYIKRPFLLEKVVVEFSATFNSNRMAGVWNSTGETGYSAYPPANNVCTFFLLNQINGVNENYSTTNTVYTASLTFVKAIVTSSTRTTNYTTRELITWGGIGGFTGPGRGNALPDDALVTNMNRLIASGVVVFGSSTTGTGPANDTEYFDGDRRSLNEYANYASQANIGMLAYAISAQGSKENSQYSKRLFNNDYANAHPEFDSITGPFGFSGQDASPTEISAAYSSWSNNLVVPIKCKAPLKKNNLYFMTLYDRFFVQGIADGSFIQSSVGVLLENNFSGRRFNNKIYGRELKNTLTDPGFPPVNNNEDGLGLSNVRLGFTDNILYGYKKKQIDTPYLLLPSDNLIFGFQLPMPTCLVRAEPINAPGAFIAEFNHTLGAELEFAAVPSKVTFYGSYVSEGKEHHDTLRQPTNSNTIHQIIGDD